MDEKGFGYLKEVLGERGKLDPTRHAGEGQDNEFVFIDTESLAEAIDALKAISTAQRKIRQDMADRQDTQDLDESGALQVERLTAWDISFDGVVFRDPRAGQLGEPAGEQN